MANKNKKNTNLLDFANMGGTKKEPEQHEQLQHEAVKDIPEVEIKTDTDVNTNVGVNTDTNEANKFYTPKSTKPSRKQVTVYLDPDIVKAFDKFGKSEGKGAKSDLINNFLRHQLTEWGLM